MGVPYTSLTTAPPDCRTLAFQRWALDPVVGLIPLRLSRVPLIRNTTYFVSNTGNDSHDGLDPLGLAMSGATYTASSRTITKTGGFSGYTWRPNDLIYISAATGIGTGLYKVASKTDANNIVLVATADTKIDGSQAAPLTNGTGISSSSGPWQTQSKVATILAAWTPSAANGVRVRFQCGGEWNGTGSANQIVIQGSATGCFCTIDSYGYGPKPMLSYFANKITSGTWTQNGSTDAWSIAVPANTFEARLTLEKLHVLIRMENGGSDANNITNVAATPFSYCITATPLLYINIGHGKNPNTAVGGGNIPIETAINTVAGLAGGAITLATGASQDNVRIQNIRVDGWGCNETDSCYGLEMTTNGAYDEIVLVDVDAYYTGYHCFGGIAVNGQIAITQVNCRCGYMADKGGASAGGETNYVMFGANAGGSEAIYYNCQAQFGTRPTDTWATWTTGADSPPQCRGQDFENHYGSGGLVNNIYIKWGCITGTYGGQIFMPPAVNNANSGSGQWGPQFDTTPSGPTPSVITDLRSFDVNSIVISPTLQVGMLLSAPNIAFINTKVRASVYQSSASVFGDGGWMFNCDVEIDVGAQKTIPNNGAGAVNLFVGSAAGTYINNSFRIIDRVTNNAAALFGTANSHSILTNNIFCIESAIYPGFPWPSGYTNCAVNGDNSLTYDNSNVYSGVGLISGTGGIDQETNAIILPVMAPPIAPTPDSPLYQSGTPTALQYDANWQPRNASTPSRGPLEGLVSASGAFGSSTLTSGLIVRTPR